MKPVIRHDDAYGLEIVAYFDGGPAFEIIERDDGYIAAGSTGRYFAEFDRWPRRQKHGMKFVRGKNALDVGCGAGRISLYLQNKGFRVTAIDASPLAVRACRKRGVKNARVLAVEDIERLGENRFDTVLLFGNNFGLSGNVRKAKRLLRQLHRITTNAAVVIAETTNPYKTTNPFHYQRDNRQRGRMPGQIRMRIRFQRFASRWFDWLFVSPNEMKGILKGTGWKVTRFIEGDRPSYVAVIEKVRLR